MANLWINYFRNENLIMNFQLVYRYILSLSKNEIMFLKKQKTKRLKKREKRPSPARVEPRTYDEGGQRVVNIAPRQLMLNNLIKLIIFNIFCHGVLPDDAV